MKNLKVGKKKTGRVFLGAQAEQKETQLHHRQASVERSKQGRDYT